MLDKKATIPGARVVVETPKRGTTIIKGESQELEYVSVYTGMLGMGGGFGVCQGTVLEIIKKPRKVQGVANCARVKVISDDECSGMEGEVYWCELRASCAHLPNGHA